MLFASLLNHFTAEYNYLCLENGQIETLNLTDDVLQISRSYLLKYTKTVELPQLLQSVIDTTESKSYGITDLFKIQY